LVARVTALSALVLQLFFDRLDAVGIEGDVVLDLCGR
jgi:hypothetical protein